MTRIEELKIKLECDSQVNYNSRFEPSYDGPRPEDVCELIALYESDLARKDAALREADNKLSNAIYIRENTVTVPETVEGVIALLDSIRTPIRSALTPARETGETK